MRYRILGRTDLKVSVIGLGTWAIGGPARIGSRILGWGPSDDAESLAVLRACPELGINFIDTADVYGRGHSEELIGKAFEGKRDAVIVATKVGSRAGSDGEWAKDFSPAWIRESCHGSLRRLRMEAVDILQLHSPPPGFAFKDELFEALDGLRREGCVRHVGISAGPEEQSLAAIATGRIETLQVVYNILERGAEENVLPRAEGENVGVIVRVPLASGFLTGKYSGNAVFCGDDWRSDRFDRKDITKLASQVEKLRFLEGHGRRSMAQAAIRFCLQHPAISTVIPGARTVAQLRENASALDAPNLTTGERKAIREALGDGGGDA